jgi:hypothetical protein
MAAEASPFASHDQYRPFVTTQWLNLPDGVGEPTIQKSTSLWAFNARNL